MPNTLCLSCSRSGGLPLYSCSVCRPLLLAATTVKKGAEAVRHYEAIARAKRLAAKPVPSPEFLARVTHMTDDDAYDLFRDETR